MIFSIKYCGLVPLINFASFTVRFAILNGDGTASTTATRVASASGSSFDDETLKVTPVVRKALPRSRNGTFWRSNLCSSKVETALAVLRSRSIPWRKTYFIGLWLVARRTWCSRRPRLFCSSRYSLFCFTCLLKFMFHISNSGTRFKLKGVCCQSLHWSVHSILSWFRNSWRFKVAPLHPKALDFYLFTWVRPGFWCQVD